MCPKWFIMLIIILKTYIVESKVQKMTNQKMVEYLNEKYIQDKMREISLEGIRLAIEKQNDDIANEARDLYTLELMNAGLL